MVSDIQKLFEIGKKYLEVKVELLKLDVKEQMGHYLMKSSIMLGSFITFLIIILFLALGLAMYLNSIFDNQYSGFFIVASFFTLVVFLLFLFRNNKSLHSFFHRILDFFIFERDE